jgi:hypothetical protein
MTDTQIIHYYTTYAPVTTTIVTLRVTSCPDTTRSSIVLNSCARTSIGMGGTERQGGVTRPEYSRPLWIWTHLRLHPAGQTLRCHVRPGRRPPGSFRSSKGRYNKPCPGILWPRQESLPTLKSSFHPPVKRRPKTENSGFQERGRFLLLPRV